MLKIVLLNLPFAAYHLPSIGLTQLKSVLDAELGGEVETRIAYVNLDFAAQLGLDLYERIGLSGDQLQSGFSEWFFRQAAFPDAPDNTEAYFARYYPAHDPASQTFRRQVLEKRRMLDTLLDGVIDTYALDRADVVGCTSMFFENMVSFALARKIKARNPKVVTVLGGATSESPSGEEFVKNVPALDFVFSGTALKSFPRFVRHLLAGQPERNHVINGVFSKLNQGAGGPAVGAMGEELDINTPIGLDYEPFLNALEQKLPDWEIKAVLPFETSRGCWWGEHAHCTFCGLNKSTMSYRAMRPDLAVELIRSLFRFEGRAGILMCVDNILQRQYVKEVFPYLDTPESLGIFYQLKANLTESEVAAMARARVKLITPGFESLSTETLKLMDKGVTAFHNLQVMKYCSLHDVHPGWNLLVGSPGEGEETYAKYLHDLPLFVHLPAPQGVFSIHFNRYSPYFVKAKEYHLDLHPLDYYEMVYPFPQEAVYNIAYDFMDHNLGAEYLQALGQWIDRLQEKLRHWQERWRDGQVPPKLHLLEREGEAWIYDSRSGEVALYPLSPARKQLLLRLEEPRRLAVLAREMADVPGLDLARDLDFLRQHGLVFEEGEKMMSLVLPRDVPPLTYRARALSIHRKLRETRALEPALGPIARTARRRAAVVRPGPV
ncbi:MAG TPA: RiPP maturation radical SAM C-methyltransferase [Thermoanaerobaculia bacterium]|nr:RiPP maturation radical SAM C-methyltransferase [Thermoanaerobaculia bacterium]